MAKPQLTFNIIKRGSVKTEMLTGNCSTSKKTKNSNNEIPVSIAATTTFDKGKINFGIDKFHVIFLLRHWYGARCTPYFNFTLNGFQNLVID